MAGRWSFEELYNSTIRFKPWRRNYTHNPKMGLTGVIPFVGTSSVLFQGFAHGLTQKAIHKENILFSGVKIVKGKIDDDTKPHMMDYFEIKYRNEIYYVEKIDPRKHNVAVRCSCLDFFMCFSVWNLKKGCLYGSAPRPYRRVLGSTRPYRNPGQYPGVCKHIWNLYSFIRASGYTKEHHAHF